VARALGPHEKITFGLYRPDDDKPYIYALLTKRDAEIMAGFLSEEVTYSGSLDGRIHNVGVEELSFQLRRSRHPGLVKCEFEESLYRDVIEACKYRHALLYVHGLVTARRIDQEITRVRADKIKVAPRLSDEHYHSFFGSDADYTGDMSSEDFVERNRYGQ
jgi:hypothetical protein